MQAGTMDRRRRQRPRERILLLLLLLMMLLAAVLGLYLASRGLHPRQLRRRRSPQAKIAGDMAVPLAVIANGPHALHTSDSWPTSAGAGR